ncbi:hypothetical protein BDV59DRAFT_206918 [Aspergillus ambiguus]|uniref:uncharacterized protein n=1 Tax=Aspergillus ambiguus TaxID=176160 RepID=UPI003CCCA8E1
MSELARTLPASWYCSFPLYQLERRAVFLKSWYLLGPVTRFQQIGEKEELLPHHVTRTGLVFAALSNEAPAFHEYFPDLEPLLERVDFTKRPYKRSIKYEGRFNWKTMVDGYQECLHCQYTHPSFSIYYPPTFYEVHNHRNFSQHIADPNKPDDGLFLYFFPNCTLNVYGGGMSSFRVCPTEDPNITRMEFDYYHLESGEKFEEYYKFVRQVAMEDYELCEKAQDNLTKGVYSEGILNPAKENGVSYKKSVKKSLNPSLNTTFVVPIPVLVALIMGLLFLFKDRLFLITHDDKKSSEVINNMGQIPAPETPSIISRESEFPDTWFAGTDIFELERRAIFSKSWLYLAHRSRFAKVGDYHTFNIAGFPIFLILGRDGEIRAFHNVCRHRAYAITKKESGSSPVLGCRYHGWSYNTYGQLIKAPHFDKIPGFDKAENSLFPIHTFMDKTGFIFINFEASPSIAPVDARGLSSFGRKNTTEKARWIRGKSLEGVFNWKMGLQPEQFFDASKLERNFPGQSYLQSKLESIIGLHQQFNELILFPATFMHAIRGSQLWYTLSFVPISAQKTSVRYDLYGDMDDVSRSGGICEEFDNLLQESIRRLEKIYQTKSLPSASPDLEVEETGTQKSILALLRAHSRLEKTLGEEVFPAMRKGRENTKFQRAEQLCQELECNGVTHPDLVW